MNKFARSITKWTKSCDKRLSRLISDSHHVKKPLDTVIHEQNGYARVYNANNLDETNVDNDNSDTTYTNMRNK